MKIYKSAEDYLETILMLQKEKGFARSVDIAAHLSVSKPSVSIAMKKLRENGYILMNEENLITLTTAGEEIAQRMYERHTVLTRMLVLLGVSETMAREDACKIEHDLSDESFAAIRRYIEQNGIQIL